MKENKIKELNEQFGLFLKAIKKIEIYIGVILLAIMVFVLFINCITRYAFNNPLVWAEEVAVYCFIWMVFIGVSVGFSQKRHLTMGLLSEKMSVKSKKYFQIFIDIFIGVLLIFLIIQGSKSIYLQRQIYTISLPIRIPNSYFYALPLVISSISMLLKDIYFLLEKIFRK